jgi:cob(I)alamin adenosyltransferase
MTEKTFYTRGGDTGHTGILGEGRVLKSDLRIEAIGAVDEANAALGLFRSFLDKEDALSASVLAIQKKLYFVMSDLASLDAADERFVKLSTSDVLWLEQEIKFLEENLDIPREFMVPGDHPLAALMDMARTIVRRAEREIVQFYQAFPGRNSAVLQFLNRLSSYCYLLEIHVLQIKKDITITSVKDI